MEDKSLDQVQDETALAVVPSPPLEGVRKLRGFAALKKNNPQRQLELARKGGASVPTDKRSFSRDLELARSAGRKGGENGRKKPTGF